MLKQLQRVIRKVFISGVQLRCPNCEQGRVFRHLFRIEQTCDVCGVRFERLDGESIGGIAITMAIIPPISIGGFFILHSIVGVSLWMNAALWLAFIILGCTLIYRHSRAAWVGISYLTGGVYADVPED